MVSTAGNSDGRVSRPADEPGVGADDQTRRNTATTLPSISASSPGMGA